MKKSLLFTLLCGIVALTACEKDPITPEQETPIPVVGIAIDEPTDAIDLTVAQSKTLQATVLPENATNKSIVWSSDDATIATISPAGVITALKAGNTKVWAKSAEDNSIMDSCEVMVTEATTDVTEITLNTDRLSIEIDQTKALTVTITPENATNRGVSWHSSNTEIATVSKTGSVTGLTIGTATITVTAEADSSKSATCTVTVTEKSIPATDMWMKTTKIDLKIGESSALDATTIPTNTTDQSMVWSSDDTAIATVDDRGVVTGVASGTTTVWVKWAQDLSIKDKCTVTILADNSYAVGDLYPDAVAPIGVVFWKDPANPANGKIVSLIETRTEWSEEKVQRNTSDANDGMVNMKTIRAIPGWEDLYPAFRWCSDMGEGWYLPAIAEMKAIYDVKDTINAAVIELSEDVAVGLDNNKDYWTSTERSLSPQYSAATIQFYKGFGGGGVPPGGTSFGSKDGQNNTRAVMKF